MNNRKAQSISHVSTTAWEADKYRLLIDAKFAFLFEDSNRLKKRVAVTLIEDSVCWMNHVHGPTRAPGFANRIYGTECDWRLDFGANSFHITKSIRDCRSATLSWASGLKFAPTTQDWYRVRLEIRSSIQGAVKGYNGHYYLSYGDSKEMRFGPHSINLADFTRSLGRMLDMQEFSVYSHAAPEKIVNTSLSTCSLSICSQCGQSIRASRLEQHMSSRCCKRPN